MEQARKKAAPGGGGRRVRLIPAARRGHSQADFWEEKTWEILCKRVARELEEAARAEFGSVLGDVDVRAQDLRELRKQGEVMKDFLGAYVDGLVAQYAIYGTEFFGDRSAKEELKAELSGGGDQLRDGGFKDVSKMR